LWYGVVVLLTCVVIDVDGNCVLNDKARFPEPGLRGRGIYQQPLFENPPSPPAPCKLAGMVRPQGSC